MIHLTDTAAVRARAFLSTRDYGIGLRLGVKASGCSGFGYVLEVADQELPNDKIFEDKDVKVFIDSNDLIYLDGTTLDWQKQGINEGFAFINPNATASCGCGESFTTE